MKPSVNIAQDMKLFPTSAQLWKFNFTAHEQYQTNTLPERAHSNLSDTVSKGYTADITAIKAGEGRANWESIFGPISIFRPFKPHIRYQPFPWPVSDLGGKGRAGFLMNCIIKWEPLLRPLWLLLTRRPWCLNESRIEMNGSRWRTEGRAANVVEWAFNEEDESWVRARWGHCGRSPMASFCGAREYSPTHLLSAPPDRSVCLPLPRRFFGSCVEER